MAIIMPHSVKSVKPDDQKAEAFISGAGTNTATADPEAGKAVVNMRFDLVLLRRIDAAAKRQGISRTAWLHVAASKALDE
jgi:hypothetical protein